MYSLNNNLEINEEYENVCPISMEKMKEPYTLACGHTFDKINIERWLEKKNDCPMCRKKQSKNESEKDKLEKELDEFRKLFDMNYISEYVKNLNDDDIEKTKNKLTSFLGTENESDIQEMINLSLKNILDMLKDDNNKNDNVIDVIKKASKKTEEDVKKSSKDKYDKTLSYFSKIINQKNPM